MVARGSLIAVEHLRLAVHSQRIFQTVHAERRIHAVRYPPRQHAPRVPVDHRYQVDKAACQADVGHIRTPHRIWSLHGYAAQQIRIHLVLRMLVARVRPRCHPRQSHRAHKPLHPLAVDDMPQPAQTHHHAPTAVKRSACVLLVDQPAQQQIFLILFALDGPAIHAGP